MSKKKTPIQEARSGVSWTGETLLNSAHITKGKPGGGQLIFIGSKGSLEDTLEDLSKHCDVWQVAAAKESSRSEIFYLATRDGPVWLIKPNYEEKQGFYSSQGSRYGKARDLCGTAYLRAEAQGVKDLTLTLDHASSEERLGALVGLGLAGYRFHKTTKPPAKLQIKGVTTEQLGAASQIALAVNLARHLVNTPPNILNPTTYAAFLQNIFKPFKDFKVEVWQKERLEKEGMGLLLGVGRGSETPPCLLHLSYRPSSKTKSKPIAFVGKGVTFDTGGLDLKPSASMRLMKKDMGGSAAVAGVAYWVGLTNYGRPCDFYIPMAENAVDAGSIRPGDVLRSRSGISVEIDNTDAEGRLILADALDVAVNQKGADEPGLVIDVATLTGAARVALGTELGALFATDAKLAAGLQKSGWENGDLLWPMPLFEAYDSTLGSQFADISHTSSLKTGGAITAALFLKRFTKGKPWIHLDIMAWSESKGAQAESGGNGQAVQSLIGFLSSNE